MSDEHGQRPTDAPFGPEETEAILAGLRHGEMPECPRCHGRLEKGPPSSATVSQFRVFLVRCPVCRRAVFHGEYLRRSTT
jgi:hypothetical protein